MKRFIDDGLGIALAIALLFFALAGSAHAAIPTGYTAVALENASFTVSADGNVDYCTPTVCSPIKHYAKGSIVTCNNATFIEPQYGVVKSCYFMADPIPSAFLSGSVPILYVPQTAVPIMPPAGAAQMIWPAASAPGCTGPAVGRQWKDDKNQYWTGSCQKKGYVFTFSQAASASNGLPGGAGAVNQPTGFPLEVPQ